ncbi:MAG: hypothetical protein FRX48_08174 [Lasallia pustulata]|uniref:Apple domain-containing protein n=1 Tax=Lasallia pustulata TaxID=136370 RepID=A0A5M8PFE0_9LECA|nr:MAG: hypothetical protein FRX48_08174 [Lasallia pustulata]
MKASFSLAAVLLAVGPAIASPVDAAVNGVLPGTPSVLRGLEEAQEKVRGNVVERAVCNADNVLRGLRNPTQTASASAFCSTYLQSTSTVTATTIVPETTLVPVSTTVSVIATETETITVATSTILCPANPAATQTLTCGLEGFGYSTYLISQQANLTAAQCEQSCLSDPNCRSFQTQTGGGQYCNTYNQQTAGNVLEVDVDYTFYDRDCITDFTPAGCTSPSVKAKRDIATPTYLVTVPASRISSACSCFITSPDAPATKTTVVPYTSVTTATTVIPVTVTATQTTDVFVTTTAYVTAAP